MEIISCCVKTLHQELFTICENQVSNSVFLLWHSSLQLVSVAIDFGSMLLNCKVHVITWESCFLLPSLSSSLRMEKISWAIESKESSKEGGT